MAISKPEHNPFAAPETLFDDDQQANWPDAEGIRRQHIQHEANVKSIATVYLFTGGICTVTCLVIVIHSRPAQHSSYLWFGLFATLSIVQFIISYGVSSLRRSARRPAIVLSAIITIAFPIGTMLGPYFIYLLTHSKSETVFSGNYQSVIARTKHVRQKTPLLAWILLTAVLLATGAGLLLVLISRF